MNYTETRALRVTHPDLSLMCPKCYATRRLGKVRCNIEIESDDCLPELDLLAPALLTYPIPGIQMLHNRSVIMSYCPNCRLPMIAIDTEIVQYIHTLNLNGMYTANSCAGHDDDGTQPYIQFYCKAPDALANSIHKFLSTIVQSSPHAEFLHGKKSYQVENSECLCINAPLDYFGQLINHMTNPATPGVVEFKKINADLGCETLFDYIISNQE